MTYATREQLDELAAGMRARNLTRGSGCGSTARAIAARAPHGSGSEKGRKPERHDWWTAEWERKQVAMAEEEGHLRRLAALRAKAGLP